MFILERFDGHQWERETLGDLVEFANHDEAIYAAETMGLDIEMQDDDCTKPFRGTWRVVSVP